VKVGDTVRVTKPTSPFFGVIGRVMAIAPSGWAMVDDGRQVFRVEERD
jgi:hypothetical protein